MPQLTLDTALVVACANQNSTQNIDPNNGNSIKHYQNALGNHISYFKGEGGVFTAASIEAGLRKLGIEEPKAFIIAKIIISEASISGCPYAKLFGGGKFAPSDLPKLLHPHDTGIFKKENGAFDEIAFDKLVSFAIVDEKTGQKVISQKKIEEYKKKYGDQAKRWKDASYKEKLIGFASTKGEFNLLFEVVSDVKINGVPYITVNRLKRFYTNGYALFCEIAAAEIMKKQNTKASSISTRCFQLFRAVPKPVVVCAALIGSYALVGLAMSASVASLYVIPGVADQLQKSCKRSNSK